MSKPITIDDLKRAKPDVIQMIDGKAKVNEARIFCYPAVLFPKRKPILLSWKNGEPAPAKDFDDAMRIATREINHGLEMALKRERSGEGR